MARPQKYKIDGEDNFITIATTRPETMLGDTAVAVNPKDSRYKNYIVKKIIVQIFLYEDSFFVKIARIYSPFKKFNHFY